MKLSEFEAQKQMTASYIISDMILLLNQAPTPTLGFYVSGPTSPMILFRSTDLHTPQVTQAATQG
jgi:hypothetical protein